MSSSPPSLYFMKPVQDSLHDFRRMIDHGMGQYHPRQNGLMRLVRAGPYIMPITFPDGMVVTQTVRDLLASSGLNGFTFRPVIKEHIVEMDILGGLDGIEEDPEECEPEGVLLRRSHSPSVAKAMGELWEVVPDPVGVDVLRHGKNLDLRLTFVPESWNGSDLFYPRGSRHVCVSERGRHWFQQHLGDYLDFLTEWVFPKPWENEA